MVTQAEKDAFRRKLQQLLARLDQDRAALGSEAFQGNGGEASGGLSDAPLHPGDLGTHEAETEVNLLLMANEEGLMAEIGDALSRLDEGTFGRCERCGHDIVKRRLQVLPYTRYCVRCAAEAEAERGV